MIELIKNFIKTLYEFASSTDAPNGETKVFCPNCSNNMHGDDSSCIETVYIGAYEYECASCGHRSRFNFEIAPTPILMTEKDFGKAALVDYGD